VPRPQLRRGGVAAAWCRPGGRRAAARAPAGRGRAAAKRGRKARAAEPAAVSETVTFDAGPLGGAADEDDLPF
jgi:hypothetical protein